MNKVIDWAAVEVEYLAGIRSTRSIAREFGCSETAIRRRVIKDGWVRNPTKAKRERVKAQLATEPVIRSQPDSQKSTQEKVRTTIADAVTQDVDDMNLALSNARLLLNKCASLIPDLSEARDIKTISETNKLNMEVIRRIRGLDEEQGGSYEDDLEALTADL